MEATGKSFDEDPDPCGEPWILGVMHLTTGLGFAWSPRLQTTLPVLGRTWCYWWSASLSVTGLYSIGCSARAIVAHGHVREGSCGCEGAE